MTTARDLWQVWRFTGLLARSQLFLEKRRLAAALAGIAFAVVLMLMQLGFRDALYDSATLIHSHLRGDLAMISTQYEFIGSTKQFTQRRLYQAFSCEDVESVTPLYLGLADWKNPVTRRERSLLVIGFKPGLPALDLPVISGLHQIQIPDIVLFDAASRPEFGPIEDFFRTNMTVLTEIEGRRVRVGGLFVLGTSFAADGNIITSDMHFLRLFPDRREALIDIGLITLKSGSDAERHRAELAAALPGDVKLLTRKQFLELEKGYWAANSPIGFIFGVGLFMGLVVGFVIVYQILYTNVIDHLSEYATLMAVGHADSSLLLVVLQQALILSAIGFAPAWAISEGLYALTREATQLPVAMNWGRTLAVFGSTILMCTASGALAVRRLRRADPAEVF